MRSTLYNFLDHFSSIYLKRHSSKLRVLAYHTVPDNVKFEEQIQFLISEYNIISIDTLQLVLNGKTQLPEKPLIITFDDGDFSVYKKGLPVLKKYQLPAILFIITDLINTQENFWWKQIEKHYQDQGKTYLEARKKVNSLKQVPERERQKYLSKIPPVEYRQLSTEELEELSVNRVAIANHTHTHPMLNNCSNEEIEEELNQVQTRFEKLTFAYFNVFAYPNGNWDHRTEKLIQSKGISVAFLFDHQLNKKSLNPLRISRIAVNTDDDLPEFKVKVSGLHSRVLSLKKSLST
ncbi:polysaccharide deacetylase family protein [Christiangramia forsetii]|uniref:Polysaccharide deacetylase n=2 Tax=Christiangramia forsetii TaxID=411153 RepID=A0M2X6_CHRFK|nr:polysaccharide deacetylase family protein [Christiangramia forsetii]GGG27290.1 hypothetical protein GCM10011532_08400 [Christiangramia forsetii]CAL66971.1 polysaccharide deacetylase [Christiangramia forsetii KT0803]